MYCSIKITCLQVFSIFPETRSKCSSLFHSGRLLQLQFSFHQWKSLNDSCSNVNASDFLSQLYVCFFLAKLGFQFIQPPAYPLVFMFIVKNCLKWCFTLYGSLHIFNAIELISITPPCPTKLSPA